MKKQVILSVLIAVLVFGTVASVYAVKDKGDSPKAKATKSKSVTRQEKTYTYINGNDETVQVTLRKETKTKGGEVYEKIKVRGVESGSDLGIEGEHDGTELKKLKTKLSNGNYREVKVMPDTASEIALERLKTNKGLNIQLKEVGEGNDLSVVYDIEGNRTTKFLGLFKVRAQLKARVDAETGEIVEFETPWWYYFVGKEVEVPKCSPENLELCTTQEDCEGASGYWYDELCNAEPQIVCDLEHLDLCTTQEDCEAAGAYWYNEICNAEPQVPINETNGNQTAI